MAFVKDLINLPFFFNEKIAWKKGLIDQEEVMI